MFNKIKKILLVIFITCLIWVWADLSTDEELPGQIVTITASQANPVLWVSLENKPEIQVKVDLSGPASRIRKIESGEEDLNVSFDAEQEGMALENSYTLDNLRRFLQDKMRKYGLAVDDCEPKELSVQVRQLTKRVLPVKCIDEENDTPIAKVTITPETVNMFAPTGKDRAEVKLNSAEKKQARQSFVEKKPYIDFGGRLRYAEKSVKIELLGPIEEDLQRATIRGTLGFIVSENWTGEYKVEWIKAPDIGSIPILATPKAKAAYEAEMFEVLLDIKDSDINSGEIARTVKYNFPEDFVRDDKIRLNADPAEAKFKLVPVKSAESGALD